MPGYGIGQAVGGYFQMKGADRATQSQERMGAQAIEEQRRQQRDERIRLAAMWDEWNARRQALMQRYGIEVPQSAQGPPANPFVDETGAMYGGFSGSPRPQNRGRNLADLGRGEWSDRRGEVA